MGLTTKVNIFPVHIKDTCRLFEIMKTSLPTEVLDLTIFSCPGYSKYVEVLLAMSTKCCESQFYGAYIEGDLVGFAEWRHLGDTLFLNNIVILPQKRGLGIGKLLFKCGVELSKKYSIPTLCLDVFACSTHARTWYENMGFQAMNETFLLVGKNSCSNNTDIIREFKLIDYPQAEASQMVYGFSVFRMQSKQCEYKIGRINDKYFRLYGNVAVADENLLSELYILDPMRSIIAFSHDKKIGSSMSFTNITSYLRMKKEM